jgi:protein-S-isoprenylcysteine O-methyltransferase Ste14
MVILHGSPTSWLRQSGVLDIPGLKLVVVAWLTQITILAINIVGRVRQEDEVLKSTFGDDWERWAKVVRYRLVPGVY